MTNVVFLSKLDKLGLSTNVELNGGNTYVRKDFLSIEGDPLTLKIAITVFPDVQNFLYARYQDGSNLEEVAAILKGCMERIVDVSWDIEYVKYPSAYAKRSRLNLLTEILAIIKECFSGGMGLDPKAGDVLTTFPYGAKVDVGPSMESYRRGTINRQYLDRRLGFGKVDSEGWCYALYNNDLKLMPL
jgi:hypothetical protein